MQVPGTDRQHHRPVRASKGSGLVELGPVLFILLMMFVLPLVNLIGLATGTATVALLTHETASRAANQPDYNRALSAMVQQANEVLSTGFARFAKLRPIGGSQSCGADLYVVATNYRAGGITTFPANTPVPPPIDISSFLYEYSVHTTYDIGPVINMSAVPYIGAVPGIGKPARITFEVSRTAEHPEGLDNGSGAAAANAASAGTAVSKFDRTIVQTNPPGTAPSGVSLAGVQGSGWNYPTIYQAIAADGETVVAENVVIVPANQYLWTDAGVIAAPGDKIWFDFRADGLASAGSQWGPSQGPAGYGASTTLGSSTTALGPGSTAKYFNFPPGSLIGKMGGTTAANTGAAPFEIGAQLYNWTPNAPGSVFLRFNDNNLNPSWFTDNTGAFIVRVIVTR